MARPATLAVLLALAFPASAVAEPIKVVYQVSEGIDQAARAMANIRNELAEAPDTKIVVVAIGAGIDFLINDAKDKNGNPFDATVEDLETQGVTFEICGNTMKARHITMSQVLPQSLLVPSGMAEIAQRQFREHYAYIKP
jgi:uncharacterized protein